MKYMGVFYQKDVFKDQSEVREYIDQLDGTILASIQGLSIDFIREFQDIINFDVLFHSPYNLYYKDYEIMREFRHKR